VNRLFFCASLVVLLTSACRDECHRHGARAGRERAALDDLYVMRKAIDKFYEEQRRYPRDLHELVPKYLRRIPKDPLTDEEWVVIREDPLPRTAHSIAPAHSGVIDVATSAKGKTCDGIVYGEL
jgi:general secretion pathway protein G